MIYKSFWYSSSQTHLYTLIFFCIRTDLLCIRLLIFSLYMTLPLKKWAVEVAEHLSEISLASFLSHYLWENLEHYWVLLISTLSTMKKYWCGISFILKILFLRNMIGSWGWCMKYSIPFLRAKNAGCIGAFMYPLKRMVSYWRSYRVWTLMCMR